MNKKFFINDRIFISEESDYKVSEQNEFYDTNSDFTTLEAWKKCREVKLFFLIKLYLVYLKKKNLIWIFKSERRQ